jgi:hypothetical protein
MQPRVQPPDDLRPYLQFFLESSITGNFDLGEEGELYGPFADDDIAPYAMEQATGWTPRHSGFLKSSQLCGTCHTVALPTVDLPLDAGHPDRRPDELTRSEAVPLFRRFHHHLEQSTYLEWLNSEYEDEIHPENPRARSCQDCHMARGLEDERLGIDIPQIRTRIAAIQDTTYPGRREPRPARPAARPHPRGGVPAAQLLGPQRVPAGDVRPVRRRPGRPQDDFMTGSKQDVDHAVDDFAGRPATTSPAGVDAAGRGRAG